MLYEVITYPAYLKDIAYRIDYDWDDIASIKKIHVITSYSIHYTKLYEKDIKCVILLKELLIKLIK